MRSICVNIIDQPVDALCDERHEGIEKEFKQNVEMT